jgi:type I restriction enzyme S subunit
VSLNLDKSSWKRVRLGDVIRRSRKQVDPLAAGVERYVAGGHIDSESLTVARWGDPNDGQMGSTFRYVFDPGQILFVSARPYLRKMGVVDFSGVVADKTYVLDAIPENGLLQDFLPFVLSSESFIEYATAEATGSMNPRLLWGPLQRYEFDLPPIEEQERVSNLLWNVEKHRSSLITCLNQLLRVRSAWLHSLFESAESSTGFVELNSLIDPERPICYGVLKPGPEVDGGPMIVDVKDYPNGQIQLGKVRRCAPEIEAGFKRSRLRTGDVIMSIRGTIGRLAMVPEELDGQNVSRDSARISGDPAKVLPEFLKLILESPDVQAEIRRTTTGLAVKGINVARIRSLTVPDWGMDRQVQSVEENSQIEEGIEALRSEARGVVSLRSALLQEIFGGN